MAKKAKKKAAKKAKPAKKAAKKAKPAKKAAKKKAPAKKAAKPAKKVFAKKATAAKSTVKIAPPSSKHQPLANEPRLTSATSFMSGLAAGAGAAAAYSSFGHESKAKSDDGEE